jgi:hypothetical protein
MFLTTRRTIPVFFAVWLVFYGCQQSPPPPREPLPMPGVRPAVPDKTIVRPNLDKSPMDMIYYPNDYPVLKMSGKTNEPPIARVIYSRPEKDGRVIFGNVVRYNEHWRLGANEATELEFFVDVVIQNKRVKKGRYVLYCIPYPERWTIILNDDLFVWGLKIPPAKDIYSFDVPSTRTESTYEAFTMEFMPQNKGMQLIMAWDNVKAILPISF